MKLSLRGEYALRALVALGEAQQSEIVPMQAISEQQEIPKRFLEQILNDLRAGGFVESKRGIAGGYRLARPAEEITVAEVVRQIDGSLTPASNAAGSGAGLRAEARSTHLAIGTVMKEVREAILKVLDQVSVATLCARSQEVRGDLAALNDYNI
jgi:Rrf2 family protein